MHDTDFGEEYHFFSSHVRIHAPILDWQATRNENINSNRKRHP
jgi:hypothetical protein